MAVILRRTTYRIHPDARRILRQVDLWDHHMLLNAG